MNIFFDICHISQLTDCNETPRYIPIRPPKLQINETNVISTKCSINILGLLLDRNKMVIIPFEFGINCPIIGIM